jgi:hypothetical protein
MARAAEERCRRSTSRNKLADIIDALAWSEDFEAHYWDLRRIGAGEYFRVCRPPPVSRSLLDERGEPVATDDCAHGLVIGDTCDFHQAIADVRWTQLVPIVNIGASTTNNELSINVK